MSDFISRFKERGQFTRNKNISSKISPRGKLASKCSIRIMSQKIMSKTPSCGITGCGQIGYSLLFRIASGARSADQPVILHLIEVRTKKRWRAGRRLHGTRRLRVPLLKARATSNSRRFQRRELGAARRAVPRKQGMERKDLLGSTERFSPAGNAIAKNAAATSACWLFGNPAIPTRSSPRTTRRACRRNVSSHDGLMKSRQSQLGRKPAWMSPLSPTLHLATQRTMYLILRIQD